MRNTVEEAQADAEKSLLIAAARLGKAELMKMQLTGRIDPMGLVKAIEAFDLFASLFANSTVVGCDSREEAEQLLEATERERRRQADRKLYNKFH